MYVDLGHGKDFSENRDLVTFFREVMARREELLKETE